MKQPTQSRSIVQRIASTKVSLQCILEARRRFLSKREDFQLKFVPIAIYACFILRDYCEFNNCAVSPQLVKIQIKKHKLD